MDGLDYGSVKEKGDMNLPKLISNLTRAQNNLDGTAFSSCFTDGATVNHDGVSFIGKVEIKQWFESVSEKYQTFLRPLDYREHGIESILVVEAHGNFRESPAILKYKFKIKNGLLQSLDITR